MLLRKKEIKCEHCGAILFNIPLYLSNFHINLEEDWLTEKQYGYLRGDLEWNCPMCQKLNRENIKLLLGEDAYISIIANKYSGYSVEEVRYV